MEKPTQSFRTNSRQTITIRAPGVSEFEKRPGATAEKNGSPPPRVEITNVVKQGILYQRTAVLKRFKKAYMFYLEKMDEDKSVGPLLKYGQKGKPLKHTLDLSQKPVEQTDGQNGVIVLRVQGSKRKFKIITEDCTLSLKAETPEEREDWIQHLMHETAAALGVAGFATSTMIGEVEEAVDSGHEGGLPPAANFKNLTSIQQPSIRQIAELLQRYEDKLNAKIEASQDTYQKFASDLAIIESELEKKHKDKVGRLKTSAQEFIGNQKEAMEMISEVNKGVYQILEKMAEKEIERDPINFIRKESLQVNFNMPNTVNSHLMLTKKVQQPNQNSEEMGFKESDSDDEFKDANDGLTRVTAGGGNKIYTPELIDELEEVFHDAHDQYM